MEGEAEINSFHPGSADVSYCQHTVGDTEGQGGGIIQKSLL